MVKQVLDFDYDISVDKMVNFTETVSGWNIYNAEFFSDKEDDIVNMKILKKGGKQIFKMNDGKFILEVEDEEMNVDYFFSEDINDLL